MRANNNRKRTISYSVPALCLLAISACSSSDDNNVVACVSGQELLPGSTQSLAFVAERATDYSSGRTERVSITGCGVVDGLYPTTGSDISVTTDGTSVYELGSSPLESITKYDIADTALPIYQYSIAENGGNPYDIVFINDTKAYLIDYETDKVAIVNPSAQSADTFITGQLDLGGYDAVDNLPEANGAVLVGDKLFVLMERVDRIVAPPSFTVNTIGYVSVFDTTTDTEIDTGMGGLDGLNGIPLSVENPKSIQYSEVNDQIFLIGRGDNFAAQADGFNRYRGGVQSIDPATYITEMVLDDGDELDEGNEVEIVGFMNELLVAGAGQAYLVTEESFGKTTLRSLNTITGTLAGEPVAGLTRVDITTLALDNQNRLWVGINKDVPGFQLLNATTGADLNTFIETGLVPINVVFIDTVVPEPTL